jgi:hypothetical protein
MNSALSKSTNMVYMYGPTDLQNSTTNYPCAVRLESMLVQESMQLKVRDATVTVTNKRDVFHTDSARETLFFISTILMLLIMIASVVLNGFFRLAPDATDAITAMSLDNDVVLLPEGSHLHANERTRLLRDVHLKLGDACADKPVRRIAIGDVTLLEHLRRGVSSNNMAQGVFEMHPWTRRSRHTQISKPCFLQGGNWDKSDVKGWET